MKFLVVITPMHRTVLCKEAVLM